jgi:hypothetical protein
MAGAQAAASFGDDGRSAGPVVLATAVGAATGARGAAAALACAGAEPDRAALLVELANGRAPRPSLVATAAARELEERLAAHLPEAGVASRGSICLLKLPPDRAGLERVAAALPLIRGSAAVIHLPAALLQPALEEERIRATAALIRADLGADRPLVALAARDLLDRGLRVAVLKRPPAWLTAWRALLGAPSANLGSLPARLRERLLHSADRSIPQCCAGKDESEGGQGESSEQERQASAGARKRPVANEDAEKWSGE